MILEKMSVKQPELDLIAEWRNQSLICLRTPDLTAKGWSQEQWVKSFTHAEKYYFIYETHNYPEDSRFWQLIGYCGLDKIDPINRTAEMGLLINPQQQKGGYGTKAVRELLKLAFVNFNLNCVFIEVIHSTNNWDFWLKQGFVYEGTLRARHYKNGRYCESRVGSILKSDWEKTKTPPGPYKPPNHGLRQMG